MAGSAAEVPQILLQETRSCTSAASDDLERLSTAGNLGLLRSLSARTVGDSSPGPGGSGPGDACALSRGSSGSGYFLSPLQGGGVGEPMTARSTSCPSMSYQQTLPSGYNPFRNHGDEQEDINLEGEVITDLPVEPTRLFPDLIPGLELGLRDERRGDWPGALLDQRGEPRGEGPGLGLREERRGDRSDRKPDVTDGGYGWEQGQDPQTQHCWGGWVEQHQQLAHAPLYAPPVCAVHQHPQFKPSERGQSEPQQAYTSGEPGGNYSESYHRFSQSQPDPRSRDADAAHHHRERAPVFAQAHSHTHRAVTRSNGCYGDIPEYSYIRYHRQGTKDTESSAELHRSASYHRQSTKDSFASSGDLGSGGGATTRQATCNSAEPGNHAARRSGRRRSAKHSSGSSHRHSTSSSDAAIVSPPGGGPPHGVGDPRPHTAPPPGGPGAPPQGSSCQAAGPDPRAHGPPVAPPGSDLRAAAPPSPGRVLHIRDLPSSVAREVMADKADSERATCIDVQEKCLRWLSSLHVSAAHES